MNSLKLVMHMCKATGMSPIGTHGNFSLGLGITVLVYFAISCYAIVSRMCRIPYEKYVKFDYGTIVLAILQVFAVLLYVWNVARNRKKFLRLLLMHAFSRSPYHKFPSTLVFIGPLSLLVSLYSAVYLVPSSRRLFAAATAFNCAQDLYIAIQFYYFLQSCHAYFPIWKNVNVFRNQLFIFRVAGAVMRVFEWPLLLIYINSFVYTVWYLYAGVCWRLQRGFGIDAKSILYYFPFIGMKVMTMVLPCLASQRVLDLMSKHYDNVFRLMNDNPSLYQKRSLFLYLTTKYQLKLRVCGFFTLGHPLITSIIAGCATYIVVLMQIFEEQPMDPQRRPRSHND